MFGIFDYTQMTNIIIIKHHLNVYLNVCRYTFIYMYILRLYVYSISTNEIYERKYPSHIALIYIADKDLYSSGRIFLYGSEQLAKYSFNNTYSYIKTLRTPFIHNINNPMR